MKSIVFKWGADYLETDEPLILEKNDIEKDDFRIQVGCKVIQIGLKKRSMFSMKDPFYMEYLGILKIGDIKYAIFECPQHNEVITTTKFYYAFACVFVHEKFNCFLVGKSGPFGMRDIQLDFLRFKL